MAGSIRLEFLTSFQHTWREIPFLANRGGEVAPRQALVAACVLDHNDISTLALSIGGLEEDDEAHAADSGRGLERDSSWPARSRVVNLRRLWHPVNRCKLPRDVTCLSCRAFRSTTSPSGGACSVTCAGTAAWSGGGSKSCWDKGGATPGLLSSPGCATCFCVQISGATRSSSYEPSRA